MSVPFHKRCDLDDVNNNKGARMYTFLLLNKRFCYFRTAFITTSILATISQFFLIYLSETTSRNLWIHFLQVSFSPGYDFSWILVACHQKIKKSSSSVSYLSIFLKLCVLLKRRFYSFCCT